MRLCIVILLSSISLGDIDPNKIDSLTNASKQVILDLKYQTLLRSGDFDINTLPNEIGYVTYQDTIGNLKKIQIKYYSTSGEGNHDFLFSNNVIRYHSYFFYSGMNHGISMTRYINQSGEQIKIRFVKRDDDSPNNRLIEELKNIGGYEEYTTNLRDTYGLFCFVTDTTSLINTISEYQYNSLNFSIKKTHNSIIVKFVDPEIDDQTTFIDNNTSVYSKPSKDSKIVSNNDARTKIKILDRHKDWYKVESIDNDYVPYPFVGYVHKDNLMPVEKLVK